MGSLCSAGRCAQTAAAEIPNKQTRIFSLASTLVLDRYRERLDVPDLAHVFPDRPVRRELAHARGVEDRHARPAIAVAPGSVDARLAFLVRRIVGEHHVLVVPHEMVDEGPEKLTIAIRKRTVADKIHCRAQARVRRVVVRRPVALALQALDLLDGESEQESCRRLLLRGSRRWRRRACRWSAHRSLRISCYRCPTLPCRPSRSARRDRP